METATRLLHRAREQFITTGELDRELAAVVRPEILTSWRRSRLSGASAVMDTLPDGAGVNTDTPLCRAAEPVLSRLAEQLSGLQAGLLLADRHARILARWAPQTSILPKMDRIASDSGSSGSEELVGTNGIGTIAEDRKPHLVAGAEHYSDMLSSFTCVGAPIFNPLSRKFEGIVTMNCDASEASPLLTSLIATTAKEVESRLLELSSRRERALLDAFLLAPRAGRAVAVIGDDVLLAGPHASTSLRALDHGLVWQLIREDVRRRPSSDLLIVPTADGGVASLSYTPILLDDKVVGALIARVDSGTAESAPSMRALVEVPVAVPTAVDRLPGRSRTWRSALARAVEHRESRVPMLIVGEPGTGKLELAKAMFDDRPVSVVDGFAIDAHDTGWATSVGADVPDNGVLILRHVDALSPAVAGAFSARLDGLAASGSAPRWVATAQPSTERVADGLQRLLDQLAVVSVELPPLRDRAEDVPDIVKHLNAKHAGLTPIHFSASAMRALTRAPWPGNIRQLENVIRGIAASGHAREVTPDLLPDYLGTYAMGRELTKMEQLEMGAILDTIAATCGNKVETAKLLGISRSTLYRKMRYFRIEVDRVD
jgi:transcriptional regulator of acetoin/glycerol metabolism